MANAYTKPEWKAYRANCLEKAGYACERCGKGETLQVHHPKYLSGRKPWDYPIEFCEVLCRGCHAAEHGIIMPREGWTILESDYENNEPSEPVPCANCGIDVTWHVRIYHPEWGETIVGSTCGENLSLGPEFTAMRSFRSRLRTFLCSPKWVETPGGLHISTQDGDVSVWDMPGGIRLEIDYQWGSMTFTDPEEAKIRAFKVLDNRRNRRIAVQET